MLINLTSYTYTYHTSISKLHGELIILNLFHVTDMYDMRLIICGISYRLCLFYKYDITISTVYFVTEHTNISVFN